MARDDARAAGAPAPLLLPAAVHVLDSDRARPPDDAR